VGSGLPGVLLGFGFVSLGVRVNAKVAVPVGEGVGVLEYVGVGLLLGVAVGGVIVNVEVKVGPSFSGIVVVMVGVISTGCELSGGSGRTPS